MKISSLPFAILCLASACVQADPEDSAAPESTTENESIIFIDCVPGAAANSNLFPGSAPTATASSGTLAYPTGSCPYWIADVYVTSAAYTYYPNTSTSVVYAREFDID